MYEKQMTFWKAKWTLRRIEGGVIFLWQSLLRCGAGLPLSRKEVSQGGYLLQLSWSKGSVLAHKVV
jgi:hypothetical protein